MVDNGIKRVYVEENAGGYDATSRILERLGPGMDLVSSGGEVDYAPSDPLDMDKESLRLQVFPGRLLKPCPGTNWYICCGYQILHVGTNCSMDCSYCILQAYFNQPSLRVFVNLERELESILDQIDREPGRIFRIGTGEFTDSLVLDPLVDWCGMLLPGFSKRKNAILELKTKTVNIQGLLASRHRDQIVVSWSLNSHHVTSREEHGAPGIKSRLRAARECQKEGFVLGFHFDPVIEYPGWREGYLRTIDMLADMIDPKGVIWISMGTLRFMPGLKTIIRRRHPDTHILDGEFVPGMDGKMRYFKPIRIEMYGFMAEIIEKWHPDPGLYLCMESDEVWLKSLGRSPGSSEGLAAYLDKRVVDLFGHRSA